MKKLIILILLLSGCATETTSKYTADNPSKVIDGSPPLEYFHGHYTPGQKYY